MVDPKSYELAEHFLDEFGTVAEALTMQLAQAIQNAVEDWITDATHDGLIAEETREERDRRLGFEPKCLTPGNCAVPHGWLRAFCERCQALALDPDRLREEREELRQLAREP